MESERVFIGAIVNSPLRVSEIPLPNTTGYRTARRLEARNLIKKIGPTYQVTSKGLKFAVDNNLQVDYSIYTDMDEADIKELAHELSDQAAYRIDQRMLTLNYILFLIILAFSSAAVTYAIMKLTHYI